MNKHPEHDAAGGTLDGIDRLLRNVRTGRFERSLSELTAAGALATAAEIYREHGKASFGNPWMWPPLFAPLLVTFVSGMGVLPLS